MSTSRGWRRIEEEPKWRTQSQREGFSTIDETRRPVGCQTESPAVQSAHSFYRQQDPLTHYATLKDFPESKMPAAMPSEWSDNLDRNVPTARLVTSFPNAYLQRDTDEPYEGNEMLISQVGKVKLFLYCRFGTLKTR